MEQDLKEQAGQNVPLYAQGDFHRELNYKLWSTSKARFKASARFQKKSDLSTRAVAFLSAYVVIFSQITVMLPEFGSGKTGEIIVFISSSLSIVILVLSLLEASQNYNVKALTFHQSGLTVSELYKELRALKTRFDDKKSEEFRSKVEDVSKRYDDILQRSDNHEEIDNECFRASKPNYEDHKLKDAEVAKIHRQLFLNEFLIYYIFIIAPPLFFSAFVVAALIWGKAK